MLREDGIDEQGQEVVYEFDVRYGGQGLDITVPLTPEEFMRDGLALVAGRFDELHEQFYTFRLEGDKELVNLRVIVQSKPTLGHAGELARGTGDPGGAVRAETSVYVDGEWVEASIFDRAKLRFGDRIEGPAIVTETDSTTLLLPGHVGDVDRIGNILITPSGTDATQRG